MLLGAGGRLLATRLFSGGDVDRLGHREPDGLHLLGAQPLKKHSGPFSSKRAYVLPIFVMLRVKKQKQNSDFIYGVSLFILFFFFNILLFLFLFFIF